jgi:hypothetical protein
MSFVKKLQSIEKLAYVDTIICDLDLALIPNNSVSDVLRPETPDAYNLIKRTIDVKFFTQKDQNLAMKIAQEIHEEFYGHQYFGASSEIKDVGKVGDKLTILYKAKSVDVKDFITAVEKTGANIAFVAGKTSEISCFESSKVCFGHTENKV